MSHQISWKVILIGWIGRSRFYFSYSVMRAVASKLKFLGSLSDGVASERFNEFIKQTAAAGKRGYMVQHVIVVDTVLCLLPSCIKYEFMSFECFALFLFSYFISVIEIFISRMVRFVASGFKKFHHRINFNY